ncbi:unnamed protein product [Arctogadus glacialis]
MSARLLASLQQWVNASSTSVGWNTSVANPEQARCIPCKSTFKLGTMGIKAVVSHMQSQKHKTSARSHTQTPAISTFCISAPPQTVRAASTDLRVAVGATPTLKAQWSSTSPTTRMRG